MIVTDPRTLRPVTAVSDCHLIPTCFQVSNKSVRLDGPFDNKIGEHCDWQLKAYLDSLVGESLKGEFSFEGGSQNLAGTLDLGTFQFQINQRVRINRKRRQKRWTPENHFHRALGLRKNGQIKMTGFVGIAVDILEARLSMVNSAFLVLYYLGRGEVYGPEFDQARALLQKAVEDKLDNSDFREVEDMASLWVLLATEKMKGVTAINPADFRKYRDPSIDMPDGVMDDFPTNCVRNIGESLVVRLPYGKGVRGQVQFSLPKCTETGLASSQEKLSN